MQYEELTDNPDYRKIFPVFLKTFFPFVVVTLVGILIYYLINSWYEEQLIQTEQAQQVDLSLKSLHGDIDSVIRELSYLSALDSVKQFIYSDGKSDQVQAKNAVKTFSTNINRYDQIRWIDRNGMERLRVDHRAGKTRVIPEADLQDKSSRYYFIQAMRLKPGEIYVSPLDLNVEHKQVEVPYRPMLRFAMPTVNKTGKKNGLLILNYQASRMLNNFAQSKHFRLGELYLLNQNGYWLYASDNMKPWDFMFDSKERFQNYYPYVWKQMLQTRRGMINNEKGIFTYASVDGTVFDVQHALSGSGRKLGLTEELQQREKKWVVVALYPRQGINGIYRNNIFFYGGIALVLMIFFAVISWRSARGTLLRSQLNDRLKLHAKVMETATNGVLITDATPRIIAINKAFTEVTGYSEEDVLGKNPSMLASGRHDESFYNNMWQVLARDGHWEGEIWNRHKNGELFPEWMSISAVYDHDGHLGNYIGIFSVLAKQKMTEERLRELANSDMLTGLINRNLFYDRSSQALGQCRRRQSKAAILFMDLDGFKPINDSIGHAAGDQVLKTIAKRLNVTVRETDTVARFGGDEFVILLTGVHEKEEVITLAEEIIRHVSDPIVIDDTTCQVGASIGVCLYPDDANSVEEMMRFADQAMYRAKQNGKGRIEFCHDK